jgi:hypothetical protein
MKLLVTSTSPSLGASGSALDLEGRLQVRVADQAQFHQQAADAHGQLVLADGVRDLLVRDIAQLLDDIEQRPGADQLGAQPGRVLGLLGRQQIFLDQDVDEFAVAWRFGASAGDSDMDFSAVRGVGGTARFF